MANASPLQPYFISNAPQGAPPPPQQQQQTQKEWGHRTGALAGASPSGQSGPALSNPDETAPPAYASLPTQQLRVSQPSSYMSFHDAQLNIGNAQAGMANQPPAHYAAPPGSLVYLHGGSPGTSVSLRQQMLVGPSSAASMHIMSENGSLLYPTLSVPSMGSSTAVACYMPTAEPSPQHPHFASQAAHSTLPGSANFSVNVSSANTSNGFYVLPPSSTQQQQQQQPPPMLLNSTLTVPHNGNANPPLSYFVLPTSPMDANGMASLAAYSSLPFAAPHSVPVSPGIASGVSSSMMAAYMPHPPTTQTARKQLQPQQPCKQQRQGREKSFASSMWMPHAQPLPPQLFSTTPAVVAAGEEKVPSTGGSVVGGSNNNNRSSSSESKNKNAQSHAPSIEVPASVSASPTSHGSTSATHATSGAAKRAGGSGRARHRRSSNSIDFSNMQRNEASVTSQSTCSTQGLPYADDPVEIDTTKRQLIVNYLPQRLTDERFKELFRPYGELMEEESHIIYDFRHHKMVPVPPSLTSEVPASASHLSVPSELTPLSVEKDASSLQASVTAITATSSSNMDLTSPVTLTRDDMANTDDSSMSASGRVGAVSATAAVTAVPTTGTTRSMPRSKGYGFIYFKNGASTERAIKELNGKEVDGKRIKVRYAEQQRSLGPQLGNDDAEERKKEEVHLCSTASVSEEEEEESDVDILELETFKVDDD